MQRGGRMWIPKFDVRVGVLTFNRISQAFVLSGIKEAELNPPFLWDQESKTGVADYASTRKLMQMSPSRIWVPLDKLLGIGISLGNGVKINAETQQKDNQNEQPNTEQANELGAGHRPENGEHRARQGDDRPGSQDAGVVAADGRNPDAPGDQPDNQPAGRSGRITDAPVVDSAPEPSNVKTDSEVASNLIFLTGLTKDDVGELRGLKQKAYDNIAAIERLKTLPDGAAITQDDADVLMKYCGWGAMPAAFFKPDGTTADGWRDIATRVRDMLPQKEYADAMRSTMDAHYTSLDVVDAMWVGIKKMGFKSGRVMEPSCGTGVFFGAMPESMRKKSDIFGVELDATTARISQLLYPDISVLNKGFQDVDGTSESFDLAVGNPPFGQQKLFDSNNPRLSDASPNIHDFFFLKSMDALKPRGLLSMVVSRYLMDARTPAHIEFREELARQAELVVAVRLPDTAFKKNAGTEVVTDILVFQKRNAPLDKDDDLSHIDWIEVEDEIAESKNGRSISGNRYFLNRRQNILGTPDLVRGMYADNEITVLDTRKDWLGDLSQIMSNLPVLKMPSKSEKQTSDRDPEIIKSAQQVMVGSYFMSKSDGDGDNTVYIRHEDAIDGVRYAKLDADDLPGRGTTDSKIHRLQAVISMRYDLNKLLYYQTHYDESPLIEDARNSLRDKYEKFVQEFGFLHAQNNEILMRSDPSWSQVVALEKDYDKGISKQVSKTTGEAQREPSAIPADILTLRTQYPYRAPTHADTPVDAMYFSLREKNEIDFDYVASLLNTDRETAFTLLEDHVLLDPKTMKYAHRDEVLSGDLGAKIDKLLYRNENTELSADEKIALKKTAAELEGALPEPIGFADISIGYGAPWVPNSMVSEFAQMISGNDTARATYIESAGFWDVEATATIDNQTAYGTSRVKVQKALEALLNQTSIVIRDQVIGGGTIVNKEQTALASAKIELLQVQWKKWLPLDITRVNELTDIYNKQFNRVVPRNYDGSYLTLPGSSELIKVRPQQKNIVARSLSSGTSLLVDHSVGTGKTFAAIAMAMEARRTGVATKPMICVPNHLIEQWRDAFMQLYPSAHILTSTPKDMEAGNRQRFLGNIANNDYDAVIIGHSSFGLIPPSLEMLRGFINKEINDINKSVMALTELGKKGGKKRGSRIKDMERSKEKLKSRLNRAISKKDTGINFKKIGIDRLIVDEAHLFKNVPFATSFRGISGLGNPEGSRRAEDMMMKVRSIQESNNGGGVVFLTATPISNSLAEMHGLIRYLDNDMLTRQGMSHFDSWAKTYATIETAYSFTLTGGFKEKTSLSKFNNMPELSRAYQQFADIKTSEDVERMMIEEGMKPVEIPKIRGGRAEVTVCQLTTLQQTVIGNEATKNDDGSSTYASGSILHRLSNLPKHPGKGEDNILVIISDLKKVALDSKVFDSSLEVSGNKIPAVINNIVEEYRLFHDDKGAQLVFLDYSTPKSDKMPAWVREVIHLTEDAQADEIENPSDALMERADAARETLEKMSPSEIDDALSYGSENNWSAYQEIRNQLISRGIPGDEIAFIHDYDTPQKREDIFGAVRSGRIRILMGSTSKMGAGMNVQNRLTALHNLDAPWRPSDLEQRNGRIIRQGNDLHKKYGDEFQVRICYYVTEGSGEAGMYDILAKKMDFINQLRRNSGSRTVEDPDNSAMDPGRIMAQASGNKIMMDHVIAKDKLKRAALLEDARMDESIGIRRNAEWAKNRIKEFHKNETPLRTAMNAAVQILQVVDDNRNKIEAEYAAEMERRAAARRAESERRAAEKEAAKLKKKSKHGDQEDQSESVGLNTVTVAPIEAEVKDGDIKLRRGFIPFTTTNGAEVGNLTYEELGAKMRSAYADGMGRKRHVGQDGLPLGSIMGMDLMLIEKGSMFPIIALAVRYPGCDEIFMGNSFSFADSSNSAAGLRAANLIKMSIDEIRHQISPVNMEKWMIAANQKPNESGDNGLIDVLREQVATTTLALRMGFKKWSLFVDEIIARERSEYVPKGESNPEELEKLKDAYYAMSAEMTKHLDAAKGFLAKELQADEIILPDSSNNMLAA